MSIIIYDKIYPVTGNQVSKYNELVKRNKF